MVFRTSIRTLLLNALKVLLVGAFGWFIWTQFRDIDAAMVLRLLRGLGGSAVLVFLPYAVVILLDARGWMECMTGGHRVPLRDMFAIRLSTDAVMNTFPAGVAFAETLRPLLLRSRFGLGLPDAIAATLLSKINIAVAQMVFVVSGLTIAVSLYATTLDKLGILSTPTGIVGAFILTAAVTAIVTLPYSGGRLTQLTIMLGRIRHLPVQRAVAAMRRFAVDIDRNVTAFAREHRGKLLRSLALFLASWLVMALETWLILSLLGADMTVMQAIALEAILSVIKLLFFFIPSAMGAQEVGILTVLTAFGTADATVVAAAFILLRRGKELAWAAAGISLFAYLRINPFRPAFMKT